MSYIKLFIATYIILFLSISIWMKIYSYGCMENLFGLFFLIIIASSFIDIKVANRVCIKECYFKDSSIFAKILSSKLFTSLFYIVASILMTISMLYSILGFDKMLWFYVAVHILLSVVLFLYFKDLLKKSIKKPYQSIFSREIVIKIMAALFVLFYIYYSLESFEPEFLKSTLQETLKSATNSIDSKCLITDKLFRFQKEIESISWWFVDKNTEQIEEKSYKIAIWLIFIFINSFAILGFNRFIVQTIYLIDKIFNIGTKDE